MPRWRARDNVPVDRPRRPGGAARGDRLQRSSVGHTRRNGGDPGPPGRDGGAPAGHDRRRQHHPPGEQRVGCALVGDPEPDPDRRPALNSARIPDLRGRGCGATLNILPSRNEPFRGTCCRWFSGPSRGSTRSSARSARAGTRGSISPRTGRGSEVALKVLHPELLVSVAADRFLREIRLCVPARAPPHRPAAGFGRAGLDRLLRHDVRGGSDPAGAAWRGCPASPSPKPSGWRTTCSTPRPRPRPRHRPPGREAGEHRPRSPEGAVLLDFGIARAVAASGSDRLTRSGIAVGTSTYMSPEQITALKEIDHRSDIYSLGCVLFECLAGQSRPSSTATRRWCLQQHLTQPAPDLRTLRPDTPRELAEGIARALQKSPDGTVADRRRHARGPGRRPGLAEGPARLSLEGPALLPSRGSSWQTFWSSFAPRSATDTRSSDWWAKAAWPRSISRPDLRHGRKVAIKTLRAGARRLHRRRPLPPGDPRRRQPAAPQRPRPLRLGRGGRHPVLRHAVRRGRVAAGPAQPGAAASPPRRGADHPRGRGGAGLRPRARRRPPRHQAREHPAPERPRPGGRLRHRAGGGRGRAKS